MLLTKERQELKRKMWMTESLIWDNIFTIESLNLRFVSNLRCCIFISSTRLLTRFFSLLLHTELENKYSAKELIHIFKRDNFSLPFLMELEKILLYIDLKYQLNT